MGVHARGRGIGIVGVAGLALALFGSSFALQDESREKTVRLKKRKVKEQAFRPGYGISEALPEEAWVTRLGNREFWFFDLDGDGSIEADIDGVAMKGTPFYVRLPEVLLLEAGQFRIRVDAEAGQLTLALDPLELSPKIIREAAVLTDLRL